MTDMIFEGTAIDLMEYLNKDIPQNKQSKAQLKIDMTSIFNRYVVIEYAWRKAEYNRPLMGRTWSYVDGFVPTWEWKQVDKKGDKFVWKRSKTMIPLEIIEDDYY